MGLTWKDNACARIVSSGNALSAGEFGDHGVGVWVLAKAEMFFGHDWRRSVLPPHSDA